MSSEHCCRNCWMPTLYKTTIWISSPSQRRTWLGFYIMILNHLNLNRRRVCRRLRRTMMSGGTRCRGIRPILSGTKFRLCKGTEIWLRNMKSWPVWSRWERDQEAQMRHRWANLSPRWWTSWRRQVWNAWSKASPSRILSTHTNMKFRSTTRTSIGWLKRNETKSTGTTGRSWASRTKTFTSSYRPYMTSKVSLKELRTSIRIGSRKSRMIQAVTLMNSQSRLW